MAFHLFSVITFHISIMVLDVVKSSQRKAKTELADRKSLRDQPQTPSRSLQHQVLLLALISQFCTFVNRQLTSKRGSIFSTAASAVTGGGLRRSLSLEPWEREAHSDGLISMFRLRWLQPPESC